MSEDLGGQLSIANVTMRRIVAGEVDARVVKPKSDMANELEILTDNRLSIQADEPIVPELDLNMIIEIRTDSSEPLDQTQAIVLKCLDQMASRGKAKGHVRVALKKSQLTDRYIFIACDEAFLSIVTDLFAQAQTEKSETKKASVNMKFITRVFRIWHDNSTVRFVFESSRTIKIDAVHNVFSHARGKDIVWAVLDTGVDGQHKHFQHHSNLHLPEGLHHIDLTQGSDPQFYKGSEIPPGFDSDGHGTHVAGIIAGEWPGETTLNFEASTTLKAADIPQGVEIQTSVLGNDGDPVIATTKRTEPIISMAPECKILAIKILKTENEGKLSDAIVALQYIQRENRGRARLKIHGVNMSVGFPFEASWYPAGSSPICKEVDRLVQQGVCVVVAAGNAGYSRITVEGGKSGIAASAQGTIADPGNSKLAITVGSTHRSRPRSAGISYFSSKGPTADGRIKPDVVAPGERIVSCAAGTSAQGKHQSRYVEMSGTSMAAPHVSGAIACLMSARDEFIGAPDLVKARLKATACDLGLVSTYQGAGLIDAFELISSGYRSS
jgi:serine protease AprX